MSKSQGYSQLYVDVNNGNTSNVINRSKLLLDKDEMILLNKGLSFALPGRQHPEIDLIVQIESGFRGSGLGFPEKQMLRARTESILNANLEKLKLNKKHENCYKIIDKLNKEECFI